MTRTLLALLLLGLPGCPTEAPDPPFTPDAEADDVLVVHGPFTGDATVAVVDPATFAISDGLVGLPGSDWVPATADGAPWLLGRFGIDVARRYADIDFGAPELEVSTGAGTNPQDVASCGGSLFLSRYDVGNDGGGDLAILDPETGAITSTIDLSAHDEGTDGTPEPTDLHVRGDTLVVALERLDRDAGWVADPEGRVLSIDCTTHAITAHATGANPRIDLAGDAVVARTEAGVELVTDSVSTVVTAAELDATEIVGVGGGDGAALVVGERDTFANEVWCVDLSSGDAELLTSTTHRAWRVYGAPDGLVWVLWRDHWATSEVEVGGIGVYDPVECAEVTSDWLTFPSDPSSLAFRSEG